MTDNIKSFFNPRGKVLKVYSDYTKLMSEAKIGSLYGKGTKILTPN